MPPACKDQHACAVCQNGSCPGAGRWVTVGTLRLLTPRSGRLAQAGPEREKFQRKGIRCLIWLPRGLSRPENNQKGLVMNRIMVCLAMLTLGWVTPRMAAAECCDHCGCQCQCCKTCRLVPDVKKVPKVTYECECEDICIPGPSCLLGYKCETDDDCECGHHCASGADLAADLWPRDHSP